MIMRTGRERGRLLLYPDANSSPPLGNTHIQKIPHEATAESNFKLYSFSVQTTKITPKCLWGQYFRKIFLETFLPAEQCLSGVFLIILWAVDIHGTDKNSSSSLSVPLHYHRPLIRLQTWIGLLWYCFDLT